MTKAVLDASALLAVLNGEPGAEKVAEALPDTLVSTVNYAEVVAKLVERGGAPEQIDAALRWVAVMTVDFDIDLARRTGVLRSATAKLGLSFGDRGMLGAGATRRRASLHRPPLARRCFRPRHSLCSMNAAPTGF
ncbi:MAG TPA: type II toxin-antitoxin system VapC family toxin [Roseiarcus sp.]|nr:type II toxin-antitoxin system VapC family toxin [Roseiarcus sp.]